jgi:hypothetical protein
MKSASLLGACLAASCLFAFYNSNADVAMRLVRNSGSGRELLRNGDFETAHGRILDGWTSGPRGFVISARQGQNGSQALSCENSEGTGWYGASQTILLDQTNALPLVVRGWSRAENVNGSTDSDYSLYLDLLYSDGTPLWGQTANFRTGSHEWERREFVVVPEKPVKSLTVHCLFRNHSGKAWFDNVSVTEVRTSGKGVLFQSVPVSPMTQSDLEPASGQELTSVATQDGLSLKMSDASVASLRIGDKESAMRVPSGFVVRDVANDSDFYTFKGAVCREIGLGLKYHFSGNADHIAVEGQISDTQGKDRAVTLVFALPLDAAGWRWGDDIRHERIINGMTDFSKVVSTRCGATGAKSLYPLAAVASDRDGLALAIDMGHPAQYRVGYHTGTKQLYIAYDFGLVAETERFPASAKFRFVLYRFAPEWGFRAAFEKLTRIFPDYFAVRSADQGLWMPFTDISTVAGWEDFGFKYHEGNNNVGWDDAHNILSFRYTEPMTWWMRMSPQAPRTISEAVSTRDAQSRDNHEGQQEMARAARVAGMWDESGQPCVLFRNEPWCNGAVWSLNPNPWLPSTNDNTIASGATADAHNAATVHWNEKIRDSLYGKAAASHLDGEYLDSLEGYVTADLNFRREHFRYTTVPLTFATETKQPALYKGLAVFEFTKWFCDEVHRLGKLTFANGVPYRFSYLCPWLDVLGTETDWVQNRHYSPAPHEMMCLWRTMSGAKPYLLLMNTDYDVFTHDMVELYFQRSLFYGMFPGMFSHNAADNPYWQNPKWYNRDRDLFKRYLPVIKRVGEAGWHAVTGAQCDNSQIWIERFGPNAAGTIFLTVFNNSDSQQSGNVEIDRKTLGLSGAEKTSELLSNTAMKTDKSMRVLLAGQQTQVLEISK